MNDEDFDRVCRSREKIEKMKSKKQKQKQKQKKQKERKKQKKYKIRQIEPFILILMNLFA